MIEPRLNAADAAAGRSRPTVRLRRPRISTTQRKAAEARGLNFALYGFLGVLAVVLLATLPPGAPLRDPVTGDIVGNTPFMDSLLFMIAAFFLVAGICYGVGAGTIKSSDDVISCHQQDLQRALAGWC